MHTCEICGHTSEDVIKYQSKIGGSDQLVEIVACSDIDACIKRREDNDYSR